MSCEPEKCGTLPACEGCPSNTKEKKKAPPHQSGQEMKQQNIKKVFAVVSGKGGVGKSSVTGLLAAAARRQGLSVGVAVCWATASICCPLLP